MYNDKRALHQINLETSMVTDLQQQISNVLAVGESSTDPAVSEGDLLRTAVEFANTPALRGVLLHVPGLKLPRSIAEESRERGLDLSLHISGDPELSAVRERYREDLTAVIEAGSDALPARTISRLKQAAARIVLIPRYGFTNGDLRVSYHYLPESLEAALAYSVLLLRDNSRPFRADFARCKLERCSRFFFRSDTAKGQSRQRQFYCCDDHMLEKHRATGALRVQRHRAKKASAAKHK
jgi:hypothetical protein